MQLQRSTTLLLCGVISACVLLIVLSTNKQQDSAPISPPANLHVGHIHGNTYCGVPPVPDPIVLEQPDGSSFQAYLFTEGPAAYLETLDGYTIIQDGGDGYYRYATRGTKGDLFMTGVPVSAESERNSTELTLLQVLRKNLRYEGQALAELVANDQLKTDDDGEIISAVFPPAGTQKALLLLIDFPDQPFVYPLSDFDNMANQAGYNVNGSSGSFRDYYLDISYGILTVNTDVEGWYTAINNRATYGIESTANRNFANAVPLIREAVDAAEAAGVDFSNYDGDGDGRVDVVEVIHSGRGAEESGNVADIWSHRWVLSSQGLSVTYDGKQINDYIIQPEKYGATNIANIGVLVHEFGHALGLPDLYDTDGSSRGIGRWCCMAGGTWNNGGRTPAQFSAWCKRELGWVNPTVLSGSGSVVDMLHSDIDDECYQLTTPDSDETFLVENRQKTGWDAHIPGQGLAIWHIDDSRSTNRDENRYLVDLEQADGDRDLNNNNNSGDNADLFPGTSNNTTFDCSSNPNSNIYSGGSSNVNIFDISESGDLVSFSYDFCSTDCSISNIDLDGGPTNIGGGTYDQSFSINYSFAPGSGTLDLTVAGMTVNAAITSSPQIIAITGLPADGNQVSATASFSAEATCSLTKNNMYVAPRDCINDNVCDALDITDNIDGAAVVCSNVGATTQGNEPRPNAVGCGVQNGWCENVLSNTVWYSFAAPASGSIDIDFNTAIDLQMALWEANSCSDLLVTTDRMMVAANDDSGSAGGYSPRIANVSCLIPGATYFVQIDGWNGRTGTFSMSITDPGISCTTAPTGTGGCGTSYSATSSGHGEWLHISDGGGQRIVSINDMFNNLGGISVDYAIHTGTSRKDGDNYPLLDRDWYITVANDNPATVRLYLTDQEFQDLINAGGPMTLDQIKLLKLSGGNCSDYNTGSAEVLSTSYSMENFSGSSHVLEYKISGFSSFFGRSNNAILPIEMKYVRGEAMDKHNRLLWASSLEENTKTHVIERLVDGENSWEAIGQLPAAGNSQVEVSYQWDDHFPLPMAFYRIKTIDLDGSYQYSDIVSLQRKEIDIQLTKMYPNPAREQVWTDWYSNDGGDLAWEIRSPSGQILRSGTSTLSSGRTKVPIDLQGLPAGLYFLQYRNGTWQESRKLLVE